jgi:cytochrome c oxidase subunit III
MKRMPASPLAEHFADLRTQRHAAQFGMWLFIVTEILMFGALFVLYATYAQANMADFRLAAGHNSLWRGTLNTYILVTSSFTAGLAVWAVQRDRRSLALRLLGLTIALGVLFLGIKASEYASHFEHGIYPGRHYAFDELMTRGAVLFFTIYYVLTGLHIVHLVIGLAIMLWLTRGLRRGRFTAQYHAGLELGTMYWSLVDIIWLVIWPLFYLVR